MATKARSWTPDEIEFLRQNYLVMTRSEIGICLGRTESSVRKCCSKLCLNYKADPVMRDEDRGRIREFYEARKEVALEEFHLGDLAQELGFPPTSIARAARKMGLTRQGRPIGDQLRESKRIAQRRWLREHGHPKGMLGKHHTEDAKARMLAANKHWWATATPEQLKQHAEKMLMTRIERYGSGNPGMRGQNPYSRTKSGKRADLNNQFFRSAWEANYARYLNFLVEKGEIVQWEFEPRTFVFEGVRRGVLTYTPDFRVTYADGSYEWHEVKGWMDAKSKAKLKRMAKFYLNEKVIVIGGEEYRAIAKWARLFDGWE